MSRIPRQRWRAASQVGFFVLFVVAPPLDLFRIDLTLGHAVLLGQDWTLGIDAFLAGEAGSGHAAINLLLRGFLPIFGGATLFLWIAWRYGRIYCGWLCPHFAVVELINGLMRRASGRPSLWEHQPLPAPLHGPAAPAPGPDRTDGRYWSPWWWLPTLLAIVGSAALWAVVLLTYLMPPPQVYEGLATGTLTRGETLFLAVATVALSIEFLLARHFFCRYACAVGLFQSLAWMANDRAMVVGFDTHHASACAGCDNACDHACPMRLKLRTLKRKMFTCTQCGECLAACSRVQRGDPRRSLLRWVARDAALPVVTGRPEPGAPDAGGARRPVPEAIALAGEDAIGYRPSSCPHGGPARRASR